MMTVATQYHSNEMVKIDRRPYLSATKPNTSVPMNRPAKVAAGNTAGPVNNPTEMSFSRPSRTRPGTT